MYREVPAALAAERGRDLRRTAAAQRSAAAATTRPPAVTTASRTLAHRITVALRRSFARTQLGAVSNYCVTC